MGYDVHITRQKDWIDENPELTISLQEWLEYIQLDKSMELTGFAEAVTTQGEIINVTSEGLAIWTNYSKNGEGGNQAWFSYQNGNIVVKNPDLEILIKMLEIAEYFIGDVQGDDGKVYIRSNDGKSIETLNTSSPTPKQGNKPWWKWW